MADKRMLELLDRLLKAVDKLEWKYDSDMDGYYVSVSSQLVEIRSVDKDGRHPYSLLVLGPNERILESVSSAEVPTSYIDKLEQLYSGAKRKEMNIDGILDNILEQLPED